MTINMSKAKVMKCSQLKSASIEGITLGNDTIIVADAFSDFGSKIT